LVDERGTAYLADFGLIQVSQTQGQFTTTRRGDEGTVRWMSPELMLIGGEKSQTSDLPEYLQGGGEKSRASDIYAFGMTILEVAVLFPSVLWGAD
jgi:serine/threonine protein kinase